MLFAVTNGKIIKWLMFLLLLLFCLGGNLSPKNPYKNGVVCADYPKGCAFLRCKKGDQCVNRKFWCKNPPCPSMLYCSKTRKESLKGPSSCEAVRCSKGFVCLVRTRHCRWGAACEQQIARCISERDYYEGPATCADFRCPSGHRCILRESLCAKAPCKLLKSCANTKDVNSWFEGCKILGCPSEHECFLRRPDDDCPKARCKHTPDCLAKSEEEIETNEQCRGWVCPRGQECSGHVAGPCERDNCRISRSCHKPMIVPANSTEARKHSWKDDIKLTFYSKFEKDRTEKNNPPARLSMDKKISRESGASGNTKIPKNTAIDKYHDRPIYKAPVYVTATARPASSGPSFASPANTSVRDVQPTVTSLSTWLNHLKLKTGVDAIEVWIRKADKQENYGEFLEWLESVKDMLGSTAYDLWLEEVRAMTVTSTAFQKWLPPDTRNSVRQNENPGKLKNERLELDPGPRNSMTYNPNEHYNYSERENINGRVHETGSMKNYRTKEDDYIYPPRPEPPTIKTKIAPTIAADELTRYYPPNPRILERTYPFNKNTGYITSWTDENSPFRQFDHESLMNPWYGQLSRNWSFRTPVIANSDVSRPEIEAWQNQFVPPPNRQQWQQERDARDRFSIDRRIESTRSPTDIAPLLTERPLRYYSRNSANEDTSWIKYFLNPYKKSDSTGTNAFGSFPTTDENFDGYVMRPGSGDVWRSAADVPHRRSKHEGSTFDFNDYRYRDRDEERSDEKLLGIPEDAGLYFSRLHSPLADSSLWQYHRYLVDYNGRNRKEKKNPKDAPPSPIASGLSRFHRIDVQPRSQSLNRYSSDSARELFRSEYPTPNYYQQDNGPIALDQRGFLFRNREYESTVQPIGLPDLWDPRYRTPLSSIVNGIDAERLNERDTMEKVVPLVSSRRRVAPNFPSEELHYEENDDYRDDAKNAEDYRVDDDDDEEKEEEEDKEEEKEEEEEEERHPLLFSLQGYVESPDDGSWQRTIVSSRNTTILPVYTTDNYARGHDDCIDYYPGPRDEAFNDRLGYQREAINVFKNPKYGGDPDFPNYLKSVFDAEAVIIMRNITGERDVDIKAIKWEYEDEEDEKFVEDSSRFLDQHEKSIPPSSDISYINKERDTVGNTNERRTDDAGSENYYFDEGIEYVDKSYPDLEQIDGYGLLTDQDIGAYFTDGIYKHSDHKRFKKNRPL